MRLERKESLIKKDIAEELVHQFTEFSKKYTVYGVFLYGSQNYGLETENSDIDTKIVVIPSLDDLIFRQPVSMTVQTDCGIADVKDIRLFFKSLKKQNMNFIETMFSDYGVYCSKYEMQRMFDLREDIAHYDEARAIACMKGMYNQALQKYEAEHSNKQLANMARMCIAMERYRDGQPYRKVMRVPNLLVIKTGDKNNDTFDNFKKATAEDTKAFAESFSMDCKPRNDKLGKQLDDIVKDIIYSRLGSLK